MSSITMSSASVPIFVRMLANIGHWLDKAEAHAAAKKFEPSVLLSTRLAPDMLAFTTQIQIACDTAKFCVARLADVDSPKFDDSETTIAQLRERISATIAFLKSVPAAKIDGSEGRQVMVPMGPGRTVPFTGEVFFKHFSLPNFFFHCTMTYALLRQGGVELGKMDYLGGV